VLKKLGGGEVKAFDNIAKLSVVGVGMRTHAGVAAALFTALGEAGINIQLIGTSEIKITVAVDRTRADEAQRAAHDVFNLGK
jgi:aspartate kinase